ncbi:MAG: DUF1849 family protein [Bauldia sp.]
MPTADTCFRSPAAAAMLLASLAAPAAAATAPPEFFNGIQQFNLMALSSPLGGSQSVQGTMRVDLRRACHARVFVTDVNLTVVGPRGPIAAMFHDQTAETADEMAFQSRAVVAGRVVFEISGTATRSPEGVRVDVASPRHLTAFLPRETLFPIAAMLQAHEAGAAGARELRQNVVGIDADGVSVTEVINTFRPSGSERLDPVARTVADQLGLHKLPHWWMRVESGRDADQRMVSEGLTYANGIQLVGTLELPMFGKFDVGQLTAERVPLPACPP